eukprot:Skav228509  [mRNA]  locus=scaffold1858:135773:145748:+ [translate_table: standard]
MFTVACPTVHGFAVQLAPRFPSVAICCSDARVAQGRNGIMAAVVISSQRLQNDDLISMHVLVSIGVGVDVHSHLHSIPAIDVAAMGFFGHEAPFNGLKLPPGVEAQGDVLTFLGELHDGATQAFGRQVGIETVSAHGPSLADTSRL